MKADELLKLIQSLDDREKRLYRRMAGQHLRKGSSNYLSLFNALAGMDVFDHETLARRVQDSSLMAQLPTHLSRLFSHVTEFLRQVDAYPSIDVQLNAACERVSILFERGLYATARKELKKAQKLALQNDNYIQLLRLADLERAFFFSENSRGMEPFKEARKFRDKEFLQSLLQQVELKLTHFDVIFYAKTRKTKAAEVKTMLDKFSGKSVQKTIRDAKASATDLILLDAIGTWALVEGDFDKAYAAYSRMDSLWVSNPDKIAEHAQLYISFITSFLNACLLKGRHNEFRNLLANLKTVQFPNELHSSSLKEALLYLELLFCLNRFEYDKGIALGPEIETILNRHKGRISGSRVLTFYFNLSSLHFLKGEYSKANRWLAKISMNYDQDFRQDVQAFIPYFQLILFIATGDVELVQTRLRALLRGGSKNLKNAMGDAILDLAQQFLRQNQAQFQGSLAHFREVLLQIINDGNNTVGVGECLFWAEGSLNGKLPGEVLKEYAKGYQ